MYVNGHIRYVFMPDSSGVYRLLNLRTGESYIGATRSIIRRIRGHAVNMSTRSNAASRLNKSPDDRPDPFFAEVLELCPPEKLADREAFWIKALRPKLNKRLDKGAGLRSTKLSQTTTLLDTVKESCVGTVG